MKYVIYCRKSTDTEDRQVLSLDSQERELLSIAEKYNLKVIKIFKESMSAKSSGRPIFNEVMKMVESGKADGILCWKLDRLARNFVDGGKIIDSLQKSVIKEIRTYESIHLPNETVFLLAMQFGMANQYSRDLSVNVKRGNREKLSRGEWPNHAPFGYLNDKVTKTIVIDPIRSKYVPRAFELYLSGSHGFRDISEILYKEGLRTHSGKKVLVSQIQRILSSVFYTGLMEREGKYYDGKHQALISKETLENAQNVMHGRSHPRPKQLFFPLRGFLKCENCGCALTASLKKGHQYYYCTNGKGICNEHKSYFREDDLYKEITPILNSLKFDEELIEIMYQAAKNKLEFNTNYSEAIINKLVVQLESLKTKESRLLDTFLSEQVSKELYDKKVLEIQNERTSIEKQIKELKLKEPASTLEPVKKVFLEANRATEKFLSSEDTKKREIISSLLWNISFKDKKIAKISLKSPFDILAKAPKNGDLSMLLGD